MGDDALGEAEKVVGVAARLIEIAGDDPDAKAAAKAIARSARTVATTIEVCLLPLAAVNFGYKKAREYFEAQFQADIQAKLDNIPEESLVEPKPSVAAPILQGLGFSIEETPLKNMYLSLLASSMDGRNLGKVHPSFSEIVRQLTANEASMFSDLFKIGRVLPLATLQYGTSGAIGRRDISRHLAGLTSNGSIYWHDDVPIMLENFQRLGLVEIRYDTFLTADGLYDWVSQHPEYVRQSTIVDDMANVSIVKGIARRTSFGEAFKIAAID